MANKKNSVRGSLLVVAVLCVTGCTDSPAPPTSTQPQTVPNALPQPSPVGTGAASTPPKSAELILKVGYLHEGGDNQTFNDPDVASLEKHVRAIDWQNVKRPGFVGLLRPGATRTSQTNIQGSLGSTDTDERFKAVVILYNVDGSFWGGAESPTLESVDAAIELLHLFQSDVEKLKVVVRQWPGGEFAK